MTDERSDEQINELRETLAAKSPPSGLENRVVQGLEEAGLIAKRTGWVRRTLAVAALGIVTFLAGYLAGSRPLAPSPAVDSRDTYVLFLRENDRSSPESPDEVQELVHEYAAWAGEQADKGLLISGEKLDRGGRVLHITDEGLDRRPWSPDEQYLGGYFLVRATSYEEAVEIAESCPHLIYGGVIEIRRINPT